MKRIDFKRILSFMLSVCMILSVLPLSVLAAGITPFAMVNPGSTFVATYIFEVDETEYSRQII